MQPQPHNAARAYASVGVETGAMSASPHQLIVMLFDGARAALKKAEWAIENNDTALKGQSITKAINIIESGLRAALDVEKGGELAANLDSLYDYMSRTLLQANLKSDPALIAEVDALIEQVGSAWKEIRSVQPAAGAETTQA